MTIERMNENGEKEQVTVELTDVKPMKNGPRKKFLLCAWMADVFGWEEAWHRLSCDELVRLIDSKMIMRLAKEALPESHEECGSERQVEAENLFYTYLSHTLCDADLNEISLYGLKAPTEESVEVAYHFWLRSISPTEEEKIFGTWLLEQAWPNAETRQSILAHRAAEQLG